MLYFVCACEVWCVHISACLCIGTHECALHVDTRIPGQVSSPFTCHLIFGDRVSDWSCCWASWPESSGSLLSRTLGLYVHTIEHGYSRTGNLTQVLWFAPQELHGLSYCPNLQMNLSTKYICKFICVIPYC